MLGYRTELFDDGEEAAGAGGGGQPVGRSGRVDDAADREDGRERRQFGAGPDGRGCRRELGVVGADQTGPQPGVEG